MTPEDWIIAFMIHLTETGKPLDNYVSGTDSISYLTGTFFQSSAFVPCEYWIRDGWQAVLGRFDPRHRDGNVGVRSLVVV